MEKNSKCTVCPFLNLFLSLIYLGLVKLHIVFPTQGETGHLVTEDYVCYLNFSIPLTANLARMPGANLIKVLNIIPYLK